MENRLRELMRYYNLTSTRLAEILDIQPSAISHLLSGRNKPGYEIIRRLLESFPEVDSRWLLLGEGILAGNKTKSLTELTSQESIISDRSGNDKEISDSGHDNLFADNAANKSTASKSEEVAKDVSAEYNSSAKTADTGRDTQIEKIVIFYKNGKFKAYNDL